MDEHFIDFFDPALLQGSAVEENRILFRQLFERFHYTRGFRYLPGPLRAWCRRHLFNVVWKIDLGAIAIQDPALPLATGCMEQRRLAEEFDACLQARVPHAVPDPVAAAPAACRRAA